MAKSSKTIEALQRQAEQELRQLTGWKNLRVAAREHGRTASGAVAYAFTATRPEAPNQPSAPIYLDAEGTPVAAQTIRTTRPAALAPTTRAARRDVSEPITISPDVNFLTLSPGQTFDEVLTVHIPPNTSCLADVYFLVDATGSMGGTIESFQLGLGDILTQLSGLSCDLAYGCGFYRDFEPVLGFGEAQAFVNQQAITGNAAAVQAAANTFVANNGGDGPEGQLYALYQLATNPGIGWRPGAKHIIVWFGDAPGHDPICSSLTTLGFDLDETMVRSQLGTSLIQVVAVSVTSGYPQGLDDDPVASSTDYPCGPFGFPGQATRITGGTVLTGISPGSIAAAIINLVSAAVSTITSVSLVPSGGTAPFVSSISPSSYGPLNLDVPHDLPFDVSFLGVQPCTDVEQIFTGTIDVVVDGMVVAQKTVEITVPPCGCEPDPGSKDCEIEQADATQTLLTMAQDRPFTMHSNLDCDPVPCRELDLPADLHPCFTIKWGDGNHDQIETEDFEILYLQVCNPFCNIAFGHLTIPQIEVTDAFGNPVPNLPDGTPSVMIVPSRMICIDGIPPCSCRVVELALKSCGALEGGYKLKFNYCLEEIVLLNNARGAVEFDFDMVYS